MKYNNTIKSVCTLICIFLNSFALQAAKYNSAIHIVDGLKYHIGDEGNAAIDIESFKDREEIRVPAQVKIDGKTYDVDATYGTRAYNRDGSYPNYTFKSALSVKRIVFEDSDKPLTLEDNYMEAFDGDKLIEDWDGEGPCKEGYDYFSLTSPFFLSNVEEVYIGRDIALSTSEKDRYHVSTFNRVRGVFLYCDRLHSVEIGSKVKNLDACFFKHCTNLTSLTIPGTVEVIEDGIISQCKNLKTLTLQHIESPLCVLGDMGSSGVEIFNFDRPFKTGRVEVNGEQVDANGNLRNSQSLTIINFGKNISEIPESMFQGCTNLRSITLPSSLTKVCENAFNGCTGLRSINIEDSKLPIVIESSNGSDGRGTTFSGAPVEELYLGRNVEYSGTELSPFKNMTDLTLFTIGNEVTELNNYLMYGCSGLRMMAVPSSVKKIGDYTFYDCNGAQSLTISGSTESIGEYAFYNCANLKRISIPNSVRSIGDYAFRSCNGATSITIGSSCETIGNFAFLDCHAATDITIGNSVRSIGNNAFYNCSELKAIKIPNSVETIGSDAFALCVNATDVQIGDGCKEIMTRAFIDCENLTYLTIGASVSEIGAMAFFNCEKISEIYARPKEVPTADESVFSSYSATLKVPTGTKSIYLEAVDTCWPLFDNIAEENFDYSGIGDIFNDGTANSGDNSDIFSLDGILIKKAATSDDIKNLPAGFYIFAGKKIFVK